MEAFKKRKLKPAHKEAPQVVAVHLDAGKIQFRGEGGPAGVREPRWGDTKVGCFLTYAAREDDTDPQVQPPSAFVDRAKVAKLCREMDGIGGGSSVEQANIREEIAGGGKETISEKSVHPERLLRTAVATTQDSEAFGWMVATEAGRRGFYKAPARAIVGDGGNWIESIAEMHFPGWVVILDFVHVLGHLYAGAKAAYRGESKRAWKKYEKWIRWAWGGEIGKVIKELECESRRLGPAPAGASDDDARRVVALTLEYVRGNAWRMDYPSYRRKGLPMTSAPVESLIKQFNKRVKGSEKFWLTDGAEAVLQSRAAYLSEDSRAQDFYKNRPTGRAVGRNRLKVPA